MLCKFCFTHQEVYDCYICHCHDSLVEIQLLLVAADIRPKVRNQPSAPACTHALGYTCRLQWSRLWKPGGSYTNHTCRYAVAPRFYCSCPQGMVLFCVMSVTVNVKWHAAGVKRMCLSIA